MKKLLKLLRKNQRGFTLIELVVVIAILGILSSVALPRVGGVTKRAKEVADKANVRILQEAVERYRAESGDEDLDEVDLSGNDKADAQEVIEFLIDGDGSYGPYLKSSFDTEPQQEDKEYTFDDDDYEFDVE